MTATATLLEAVGAGPDSEAAVTVITLSAGDMHSTVPSVLTRNGDGSPVQSYERWLRLRFAPPFGRVSVVRAWADNYAPRAGWSVLYGLSSAYRMPTGRLSDIATSAVPTADPGENAANITQSLSGPAIRYTPWIVFQAVLVGGGPAGALQDPELRLTFCWREA